MKTKEEILQDKYTIGDVVFNNGTPKDLAQKIIDLYNSRQRVTFDFGNVETKESWGETHDISGRIGMSKGYYGLKYPLLVHNTRSMGGGMLSTTCILSIKESSGSKRLIYSV